MNDQYHGDEQYNENYDEIVKEAKREYEESWCDEDKDDWEW